MSDNSWVLRGVDPENRQWAMEEAERRGLSVSDFLTQVLLSEPPQSEDGPAFDAEETDSAPDPRKENFAFRHRVEALERRLGLAVGGLDSALHALDSSVFGIAGRLDETEALTADNAHALSDLTNSLVAVRKRLIDAEDNAEILGESIEAGQSDFAQRCDLIDARVAGVDQVARGAEATGVALYRAHEALQHALAQDFNELANENYARITTALEDMRAVADDAARHADNVTARAIETLRISREAIEQQVADQAADTRERVQDAFADAAERLGALADRVLENDRSVVRFHEQLSGRLIDVEDAAQIALEETAETLRQADAALAAEIDRAAHDWRGALDAAYAEMSGNLAEVTERQLGGLARLKLVDSALSHTINDVTALRETVDARVADAGEAVRQRQAQSETDWDARFTALAVKVGEGERQVAHAASALSADTARVEACTFAALEKLSQDLVSGDARLEAALSDTREQQAGAAARLKLIDKALGAQDLVAAVESGAAPLSERLAQLEHAVRNARSEQALAALGAETETLAAQVAELRSYDAQAAVTTLAAHVQTIASEKRDDEALVQRVDDLRARVLAQEGRAGEAADRVHGIARMLGRVTAQNADASTQSEERLHKLELALADLRLETYATPEAGGVAPEALQEIAQRIEEMEQRQADALETLRADIAYFIGENDRRLATLEQGGIASLTGDDVLIAHAVEARLTSLEQRDVAADFEMLRKRVEDRILNVESRNVRALEQVSETVALIERRFHDRDEDLAQSA